jgi:hypothetical protein
MSYIQNSSYISLSLQAHFYHRAIAASLWALYQTHEFNISKQMKISTKNQLKSKIIFIAKGV